MIQKEIKKNVTKKYNVLTQAELIKIFIKEPPIEMIWDSIPKGSTGIITGVAKTGKTTFAENLALSLAVGRKHFWERKMIGKPQKVLYVNLEETYRIRSPRNIKQFKELLIEEITFFNENYLVPEITFPTYINTDDDWLALRQVIEDSEAEIIIIDSLTHLFNGTIEDSTAMRKFCETFDEYISPLGLTIIVVHHNVKGMEKPITMDSISGSRVVSQFFQYGYGMAKTPFGITYFCELFNKYKPVDDQVAIVYEISENQWLKPQGVVNKYSLYGNSYGEKIDFRKDSSNEDLILAYLSDKSKGDIELISAEDLKTEFIDSQQMSKDTMYIKLKSLLHQNLIYKPKKGFYSLNKSGKKYIKK